MASMMDTFPPGGLWRLTSGQRARSWSLPEEGFGMPEGLQHGHRKVPALWGTPHGDLARPCRCGQRCSFRVMRAALGNLFPPHNPSACFPGFCNFQRVKEVSLHRANLLGKQGRFRRVTGRFRRVTSGVPALRLSHAGLHSALPVSLGARKLHRLLPEHKLLLSLHTLSFNEQ